MEVTLSRDCHGLTSVTIPASVTEIKDYAFYYCPKLTSINVAEQSANYASIDGVLYDKDITTLIVFPTGKTAVTIPNSVTTIKDFAFYCAPITSVTIPSSVTAIGAHAFSCASSLTSATLSSSMTNISEYTFYNCTALTSVTIPDSITAIGSHAFDDCESLTDVYYTGTQEQWEAVDIDTQNKPITKRATIHYNSVLPTEPATEPPTTEATTEAVTESISPSLYGDIDCDNDVDIVDVLILNQYLLGVADVSKEGLANADVNNDTLVDDDDAMNVLKSLVNLVSLPVQK